MKDNKQLQATMLARGFVSTKAAAALTNRPLNTIRVWCKAGKISFVRSGVSYFVNLQELRTHAGVESKPQQKETQCA